MIFKEVENLFLDYEEEKHKFIQQTQFYFLERGLNPYVWFDEEHRLRTKMKYTRTTVKDFKPNKTRDEFLLVAEKFAEKNNLKIRFIQEVGEIDMSLQLTKREQWSTEIIYEVKK